MVFFGFHLNCEAYKIRAKQSEEAEELEDTQGYMEISTSLHSGLRVEGAPSLRSPVAEGLYPLSRWIRAWGLAVETDPDLRQGLCWLPVQGRR
ncbi:UNVERIFIED_CONTAM: hypothetical protein FKN15_058066 [Acipenser sinensis]